ncbi:pentapeptide repeat-containing protein [Bacillus sp. JCM 19034]|uniref:pentapeptide repeat-containing protein n=1 Tax=Bacillus sp. JCM 19034 TaxID=1481928 RepID=UPI0007851940|nr:pentapeptide repeat-containing protein [Bacillus sp. JCM 19034]
MASRIMKIEQPKGIKGNLRETTIKELIEHEDYELSSVRIEDETVEFLTIEKPIFSKVVFKNVTFHQATFPAIDMTDVVFENCNLANVKIHEGLIHRVAFKGCKCTGLDLLGAHLGM